MYTEFSTMSPTNSGDKIPGKVAKVFEMPV